MEFTVSTLMAGVVALLSQIFSKLIVWLYTTFMYWVPYLPYSGTRAKTYKIIPLLSSQLLLSGQLAHS